MVPGPLPERGGERRLAEAGGYRRGVQPGLHLLLLLAKEMLHPGSRFQMAYIGGSMRAGASRRRLPSVTWFWPDFTDADRAGPGPHHQAQAEEDPVPADLIDGHLAGTGLKIEPW